MVGWMNVREGEKERADENERQRRSKTHIYKKKQFESVNFLPLVP